MSSFGNSKPRRHTKSDITATLRKSWYKLRLSVRHPTRIPTWDAVVLTAASPEQAKLYDWQLNRAKRLHRIAPTTVTLAVPDPDGCRIGSVFLKNKQAAEVNDGTADNGASYLPYSDVLEKKQILLLHAGGDSKRVPWANPMGKVFLPLPYLAADDPDGPVPLLFDHILAISSCARQAFKNEGGLFIMTGDVLPCFDASSMVLPENTSCIITVPITLDIASNHGVVVASETGSLGAASSVSLVDNLLQKPTVEELVENQAILDDGRTLLDTGIIAVRGKAWVELVKLACSCQPLIEELLESKNEASC
ncbi:hypothetical protein KSS87_017505 [Heliosperma pusillum]|nr:hypothetical protein KSS87_017505 [Heliosperma pusillum]